MRWWLAEIPHWKKCCAWREMSGFKYEAIDSDGRSRTGVIERIRRAGSLESGEQGLIAVRVEALSEKSVSGGRRWWLRRGCRCPSSVC